MNIQKPKLTREMIRQRIAEMERLGLIKYPRDTSMHCLAKTRSGGLCQKHGMANGRCRLHGGLSPKGKDHWNWTHGRYTKEQRHRNVQASAELKELKFLMIQLGMI